MDDVATFCCGGGSGGGRDCFGGVAAADAVLVVDEADLVIGESAPTAVVEEDAAVASEV